MLQELFDEYQKNLDFFFQQIDLNQVEHIVDLCLSCPGTLIFTGVGKSGIIAEKLTVTMISTGTKALFLPPQNALHGDIGIVSSNDIVILISKSGESEELLHLLPFIRQRGAKTIAWTLHSDSKLTEECDVAIKLPFKKELCPFDLAPTTSTAVQLIFGDVLSVALMKAKGFGLDDYALNHPAGSLGKKMILKVKDIMLKGNKLPICKPEDSLKDILVELTAKRCGCILIVNANLQLEGIFTDGDLRRSLQRNCLMPFEKSMAELMTTNYISTHKNQRAWDALKLMQKEPTRWVMMMPVIENKRLIGLIRMHDIVRLGIQ